MKSTGIVRKIDELGRIVLPAEMRRILGIDEKDTLEIYADGDTIMLRKYQAACVFCGCVGRMSNFRGRNICPTCISEIRQLGD